MSFTPFRLIILGVVLMLFSAVASFVMALRWIPSTLWLNFFAAAATIVGLTIGLYGMFQMTRPRER
jgi:hypothetical protein